MVRLGITVVFLALFILSGTAQATWFVDDDNVAGPWEGSQANPFQHIQDGIVAAVDGDTVRVFPGHYVENIDFLGKAITLKSDQGPEVTTIDGNQTGSVVLFISQERPNSILQGFTVTNGSQLEGKGGGIYCFDHSSPTIEECILKENIANSGGGICCDQYSSPTIERNIVSLNEAHIRGGGILCYHHSSPIINNNTIINNVCTVSANGGGISCSQNAHATITDNSISGNEAGGNGGGISCENYSDPIIGNNTISDNLSFAYGGAVFCLQGSDPTIKENLVFENEAGNGGGAIYSSQADPKILSNLIIKNSSGYDGGGGISCEFDSRIWIVNNTIFGNTTAWAGGGILFYDIITEYVIVTNNIIWENIAPEGANIFVYNAFSIITYNDIQGGWEGEGNINENPLFVDKDANDFHLKIGSPCIDSGNSDASWLPEIDFEGDDRIVDGNWPLDGDARVDIGADELLPEIAARFGNVNDSSPSLANVLLVNGSPGDSKRVFQASVGSPITLSILNSPAASIPVEFALYWIPFEPTIADMADQPYEIGTSCMQMPLSNGHGMPLPYTLVNNTGFAILGFPLLPGMPPAPCTIFESTLPAGTYTLQGYIYDLGSTCPHGVKAG